MTNKFLSQELSKINSEAEAVISSHLSRLDQISNDIKVLESTIQKAAIPFTFVYVLRSSEFFIKTNEIAYGTFTDSYLAEDHCLVWMQTEKGARLLYNIYSTERDFFQKNGDEVKDSGGQILLKFSRPLVETKALFRMEIEKELPYFYRYLIEDLKREIKKEVSFHFSPFHESPSHRMVIPWICEDYYSSGFIFPTEVTA